jgi:glyoxylase-like metal-dependent hydrolase (beta-lactamase superfamily II)
VSQPDAPESPESDALYIEQMQMGPLANFVYLVGSKQTREVAIVDPAWDIDALLDHIQSRDLTPVAALVTHYHPDHIGGEVFGHRIEGLKQLMERQAMKVYVNTIEADGVKSITGLSDSDLVKVRSGDSLTIGDIPIQFLHTPGHTPGSHCFRAGKALVSGDTLFAQGCGRVDLPGGDPDQLYESLQKLAQLPDDVVLFPGHDYGGGPQQTMGETKKTNMFLRIPTLQMWRQLMGM